LDLQRRRSGDGQLDPRSQRGADAATVDVLVSDDKSSFGPGVAFDSSVASDASTLGLPSTADHCIAVAAHTGHQHSQAEPVLRLPADGVGEVRDYSPWGPRIDGMQKPDVAAPDNPGPPPQRPPVPGSDIIPYGPFMPFGGTSGAAPHVLGVAALLYQTGVRGDDVRTASSRAPFTTASPVMFQISLWLRKVIRRGRLGVSPDGAPPTLTLTADPPQGQVGKNVKLVPTAAAADGSTTGLEIKWDDGYDGTWDVAYAPVEARQVTVTAAGTFLYKARVRDATGRFAEALVSVPSPPPRRQGRLPLPDRRTPGARRPPRPGRPPPRRRLRRRR